MGLPGGQSGCGQVDCFFMYFREKVKMAGVYGGVMG